MAGRRANFTRTGNRTEFAVLQTIDQFCTGHSKLRGIEHPGEDIFDKTDFDNFPV